MPLHSRTFIPKEMPYSSIVHVPLSFTVFDHTFDFCTFFSSSGISFTALPLAPGAFHSARCARVRPSCSERQNSISPRLSASPCVCIVFIQSPPGGLLGRFHFSVVRFTAVNILVCKLLFEQVFSFWYTARSGLLGHAAASRAASCLRSCTLLHARSERFLHVLSDTHFLLLKLQPFQCG